MTPWVDGPKTLRRHKDHRFPPKNDFYLLTFVVSCDEKNNLKNRGCYSRKVINDQICVTTSKGNTQMVEEKYALKGLYPGERLSTAGKKLFSPPLGKAVWREAPEKRCF